MSEQDLATKLTGYWYNQLGSTMHLTADNKDGSLSGKYYSAVGEAENYYILTGRFDTSPEKDKGTSLGWVVTYRNSYDNAHSTATWSGQFFDGSHERILTHWLLTSGTAPDDVWESTRLGHDTFTRTKPSDAEIAQARALTVGSPNPPLKK